MPLVHGEDKEDEARRLHASGNWKLKDIADELEVSVSTVHRWVNPESMTKARRYARNYAKNNQALVVERQRGYRADRKKNPELYEAPRKRISQIIEPD